MKRPKFKIGITLSVLIIFLFTNSIAYCLCVDKPTANLRSKPKAKSERTWKVYKYMPFKKIASKKTKKGLWYKVADLDGDEHWIASDYVTTKYKCAVARSENINVHTKPNIKSKKARISPANKYYSFKVIDKKGSWINVTDEKGNKGWIAKEHLWIQ